jgi:uncharacterized protein YndB with AHSA1/START domain
MDQRRPSSIRSILLRAMVIIAVLVVLFGGSVLGYGIIRSEPVRGNAQVEIHAPPEQVFALLADPRRNLEWRTDLDAIHDYRKDHAGLAAWTEVGGGGDMDLRMTERVENSRIVIVADDEFAHFRGEWVFTFEPRNGHTLLSLSETGEVPNPFIRGMFHLLANRDRTWQQHLDAVKTYMEHVNRRQAEEP